ncbi:hypothetical protein BN2475_1030018 [Paraburkholderia ribeironis]|uniref:Uncharacterized protein n=1 Tax=Paraburkholderia ribeironis TaxID=1247936 RepID=A0A1N7SM13_9BURK|nr:hypothetical protein BN2475_1030018 [Paraburkholderia ribeironis]
MHANMSAALNSSSHTPRQYLSAAIVYSKQRASQFATSSEPSSIPSMKLATSVARLPSERRLERI